MAKAKRLGWIYGACLIALIVVAALLESRRESQQETQREEKVAAEEKLQPVTAPDRSKKSVAALPSDSPKSASAGVSEKPLQVAQPPSLKALREDVAKNPHETPQALLRFGADLGVRMQEAKKDKSQAIQLLSELKGCSQPASTDDSPVQARAICLVTAREIAQIWPDLKNSAEEIVSGSDDRARELAAKISSFSR